MILFLINEKYLDYLAQDELELIYCKNNPKVRALLIKALKSYEKQFNQGLKVLRALIDLGDESAKDLVKKNNNLKFLN